MLHIATLPGKYGIGQLGEEAYAFADFLSRAGQSYWQVLPLVPTGYGDSPYQSFCSVAGNEYFISLDKLAAQGLLTQAELKKCRAATLSRDFRFFVPLPKGKGTAPLETPPLCGCFG